MLFPRPGLCLHQGSAFFPRGFKCKMSCFSSQKLFKVYALGTKSRKCGLLGPSDFVQGLISILLRSLPHPRAYGAITSFLFLDQAHVSPREALSPMPLSIPNLQLPQRPGQEAGGCGKGHTFRHMLPTVT